MFSKRNGICPVESCVHNPLVPRVCCRGGSQGHKVDFICRCDAVISYKLHSKWMRVLLPPTSKIIVNLREKSSLLQACLAPSSPCSLKNIRRILALQKCSPWVSWQGSVTTVPLTEHSAPSWGIRVTVPARFSSTQCSPRIPGPWSTAIQLNMKAREENSAYFHSNE